jgi:uncharacterized protein YkwD
MVYVFLICMVIATILSIKLSFVTDAYVKDEILKDKNPRISYYTIIASPTPTNTPTPTLLPTKKPVPSKTPTPTRIPTPSTWGVSEQVGKETWTIKVAQDDKMASPQDIFAALNNYRSQKGSGTFSWDNKLADFAVKRANTYASLGKLDEHAGFESYVKDVENMKALGFWGVGENSSFGYKMLGVHLIEWVFAGDAPHNNNQLDPSWTHVGIGVNGTAVDIVFGKNKI